MKNFSLTIFFATLFIITAGFAIQEQRQINRLNEYQGKLEELIGDLRDQADAQDFTIEDCRYRLLHFGKLMESDYTICDTMCNK